MLVKINRLVIKTKHENSINAFMGKERMPVFSVILVLNVNTGKERIVVHNVLDVYMAKEKQHVILATSRNILKTGVIPVNMLKTRKENSSILTVLPATALSFPKPKFPESLCLRNTT